MSGAIEHRTPCDACANLHASPSDCAYPRLRAMFGDISADEDRFLRWMAGWDLWTLDNFASLTRKIKNG